MDDNEKLQKTNRPKSFSDIEDRVLSALEARDSAIRASGITENLTVVGMSLQPLQDEFGVVIMSAKMVPMVVLVGESTGRVYHFALKALLPDLEV